MNMPFRVCSEMEDLREYLTKQQITWTDVSSKDDKYWICRTHFWLNGNRWSIIHGYGTYGGFSELDKDSSLLELWASPVNDGDPVGYLTGKQVIEYIEQEVKGNENKDPG